MPDQVRAEAELKKVLTAEDAPATLRLVLHDAATYNANAGTGGLNGSIVMRWEGFHFSRSMSQPRHAWPMALAVFVAN